MPGVQDGNQPFAATFCPSPGNMHAASLMQHATSLLQTDMARNSLEEQQQLQQLQPQMPQQLQGQLQQQLAMARGGHLCWP